MTTNPTILRTTRIALSLLFIVSGAQKLIAPSHMAPLFHAMGLPGQLALLIGAFELAAGLAFAAGFRLRWTAMALVAWSIVTALIGHRFWVDPTQVPSFLKNVGLAGAFLLFAVPAGRPGSAE